MTNAKVNYPDPEELEVFYERVFRLSSERALNLSENLKEDEIMLELYGGDLDKICGLLSFMMGAEYQGDKQSKEGASYKSLAYVAHLYGLTDEERRIWYQAGSSIPLSQGHVSYLIHNVQDRNSMFSEVDEMVSMKE
jgi:hypothetical protein